MLRTLPYKFDGAISTEPCVTLAYLEPCEISIKDNLIQKNV